MKSEGFTLELLMVSLCFAIGTSAHRGLRSKRDYNLDSRGIPNGHWYENLREVEVEPNGEARHQEAPAEHFRRLSQDQNGLQEEDGREDNDEDDRNEDQAAVGVGDVKVKEVVKLIPFQQVLRLPVNQKLLRPIPFPVPFRVLEPFRVHIPVPIQVEKIVHVPVEKIVKYPVVRPVPVKVVKEVHVPVPQPYSVPVPIYNLKLVIHSDESSESNHHDHDN